MSGIRTNALYQLVLVTLAFLTCFLAEAAAENRQTGFSFIAIGDTQDVSDEGLKRIGALIDRINQRKPAFTVHIGDLKGGEPCTDQLFKRIRTVLDRIKGALVFTPGDNDWTDCHREKAGRFDPHERLSFIRKLFFQQGRSLGQKPIELAQQTRPNGAGPAKFIENSGWTFGGVTFATLHIVGSNNNLRQDEAAAREHFERDRAVLGWMEEAFKVAQGNRSKGLVLFIHANPKWDARWWDPTGFDRFRAALGQHASRFAGPILVVHGDTHTFRIDQPLKRAGKNVANVTRLEVFGPPRLGAVEVRVMPDTAQLFWFQPIPTQ